MAITSASPARRNFNGLAPRAPRAPNPEPNRRREVMTGMCVCRKPKPVGEGKSEHCVECGAWTEGALALSNCEAGRHLFAEKGSRYNLRCIYCGVSSLDAQPANRG